jgi:chemotaxis response regulator CheB
LKFLNVLIAATGCEAVNKLCAAAGADASVRLADTCRAWADAPALAERLRPDVIALDMRLGESLRFGMIGELRRRCGAPVLAMDTAADSALGALDAGAADFVLIPDGGSDSDERLFAADALERIKMACVAREAVEPAKKPLRLLAVFAPSGGQARLACMLKGLTDAGLTALAVHTAAHSVEDADEMPGGARIEWAVPPETGELEPGHSYLVRTAGGIRLDSSGGHISFIHNCGKPGREADEFFLSVAKALGEEAACVLDSNAADGRGGLRRAAERGALAIAENKNAILREIDFTLPGGVIELPLEDIAGEILKRL